MKTYIYYYRQDVTCEPIGRVKATSLDEAREYVMQIKQLSEQAVLELFVIKRVQEHENNI